MVRLLALALVLAAASPAAAAPSPAVERGARIAEQRCSGCHAVGAEGHSRNGAAPPFRGLAKRYSPASLDLVVGRIASQGHFEMRPQGLTGSEADDLAAYIGALKSR
jgi:mono/diheme cytochrome c family protein